MIRRVERFETMGREFRSEQAATEFREGLVEQFFRAVPGFQDMPATQRIPFIEYILNNRQRLQTLLDFAGAVD